MMATKKNTNTTKKKKDTRQQAALSSVISLNYGKEMKSSDENLRALLKSNGIHHRDNLFPYHRLTRFGFFDPYNKLTQTKEYLFFTKPDCHIVTPGTMNLQPCLKGDPFFVDLVNRYPHVVQQLQSSAGNIPGQTINGYTRTPFMNILCNNVKSTLEFPALTANDMEGPSNMYGTHIDYRKDAWTGDENVDFSLEFEDSKYAEIYILARAYEEYQRYKNAGLIYPPDLGNNKTIGDEGHVYCSYIKYKELHDTFGIYKIIVDDTYENIVYYGYVCGTVIKSVPRDAFNDLKGDGLTFTIDFKAFCVVDTPIVLSMFNKLVDSKYHGSTITQKPLYRVVNNRARMNGNWVTYPMIGKYIKDSKTPKGLLGEDMAYGYKLLWF